MREIRLRAWDRDKKHMAYQGTPDLETLQSFVYHWGDRWLMEASSRKDIKGKLIWEDDLIYVMATPSGSNGNRKLMIGKVSWSDFFNMGGLSISVWHEKTWYAPGSVDLSTIEVIGNIYENPELLQ